MAALYGLLVVLRFYVAQQLTEFLSFIVRHETTASSQLCGSHLSDIEVALAKTPNTISGRA